MRHRSCWLLAFSLAWAGCKQKEDLATANKVAAAAESVEARGALTSPPAADAGALRDARGDNCIPGFRAHVLVSALGFSADGRAFAFTSEGQYVGASYSDATVGVVVDARSGATRCFYLAPGDLDPDEAQGRLRQLPGADAFAAWQKSVGLVASEASMLGPDGRRVEIDADPRSVRGTLGDDGYDYVCRGPGTKPDDEVEESPEAPPCGATLSLVVSRRGRGLGRTPPRSAGNLGDVAAYWSKDGRRVAFVHNGEDRSTVDGAFVAVTVLELSTGKKR